MSPTTLWHNHASVPSKNDEILGLLAQLVEALSDPATLLSPESRILAMNRPARAMAGLGPGDDLPETCWEMWRRGFCPCPPGDPGCPVPEALHTGKAVTVLRKDVVRGVERDIEVRAAPVAMGNGDHVAVIHIQRVLSDTVLNEVLAQARDEWEATADAVPDMIFLSSHGDLVVRCNQAARKFLGLPFSEVIGKNLRELLRQAGVEGVDQWNGDNAQLYGSNPRLVLELHRYATSPARSVTGNVVVLRDVTHLRRLEKLATSMDLMNNLGHVVSFVRHEIGNPANAIKTALTVLTENWDSFDNEKRLAYIARSLADIGRLQDLLHQLRSFTFFEVTAPEPTALGPLLEHLTAMIAHDMEARSIRFGCSVAEAGDCWVLADAKALQQVVLSIAANSIEAMEGRPSPCIRLDCKIDGPDVRISLEDNGKGIPADELALVFLPLYTTKDSGTGLGLYLARTMVTRMGGTIEMRSQPNRQTVVEIVLPRIPTGERHPDSSR
ncbi:MAG: hypothetical protein BWK76_05100 [Desulfobulbaceae bacterium A2]|nr:MAG: hypothetical protein BWK76_05100 [Desulfobulbaceae bacterium A2]